MLIGFRLHTCIIFSKVFIVRKRYFVQPKIIPLESFFECTGQLANFYDLPIKIILVSKFSILGIST